MRKRITLSACLIALAIVSLMLARHDVIAAYHRWRFQAEYDAWRHPPITQLDHGLYGQDFTDTTAIESRLATLVHLNAVRRIEHTLRQGVNAKFRPTDFNHRLETGTLPPHLHLDIIGSMRSERQGIVVWCDSEHVIDWTTYLDTGG